jgi:hypothetical protein
MQLTDNNGLSSLHVTFCTEEEVARAEALGLMVRKSQQFHWRNEGYDDFDGFLAGLNSRKRKNLRKERAQAQSFGGTIHTFSGDDLRPEHWDAFWQFYQDTGARKWGTPYLTRRFFDIAQETLRDDMALVLAVILCAVLVAMPSGLPRGRKGAKFSEVFSDQSNINWLSAARMALFGARDVWFVVGIPIYFYAVLSDGSTAGNRAAFFMIGTFMAGWIILYGAVQAAAPRLLRAASRPEAELIRAARGWAAVLCVVPALLALAVALSEGPSPGLTAGVVAGLLVFGGLFAVNSSLHSYLILAFTRDERVTMDVGFYYMANAAGRLIGTVLSGLTYQVGGLALCLATAAVMVGLSALAAGRLEPQTDEADARA